jgi:hypothetical protein
MTKQGITEKSVSEAVAQMACIGIVKSYEVSDRVYLYFPKWHLHQRIRESKEKYPAPPDDTYLDISGRMASRNAQHYDQPGCMASRNAKHSDQLTEFISNDQVKTLRFRVISPNPGHVEMTAPLSILKAFKRFLIKGGYEFE